MKIIIIRHAEPDYEHDSLTEKGMREATLLSTYLKDHYPSIDHFYVSPLGRAKETFEIASANNYKETPLTFCPWLVEFKANLEERKGIILFGVAGIFFQALLKKNEFFILAIGVMQK